MKIKACLILAVTLVWFTAAQGQSIFSINGGETAWAQYHKAIADFVGGSQSPSVIQPLSLAQRVEWDTQSSEFNLFLKQDVGNSMPNWTPLYTRSISTVSDAYLAFLD